MLIIEANYSKKLGLPGYSSHQYSVTVRSEIADVSQVSQKSQELYGLMQSCVDREIQQTGFLPNESPRPNGNGHHNGQSNSPGHQSRADESWKCSLKQKELILKIVDENRLDKNEVDGLAKDMFNAPVKSLNKLQASGLIKELIEKYPGNNNGRDQRPYQRAGGR